MPSSAPNRASDPSMPNMTAASTAASVPVTNVRSRGMASDGTGQVQLPDVPASHAATRPSPPMR